MTQKALAFLLGIMIAVVSYTLYKEYNPAASFYLRQVMPQEDVKKEEPPVVEQEEPKAASGKQWIDGPHLEWRVPEGKTKIYLKYKEKNGRIILDYDFKVQPGQRIEIITE